MDHVDDSFPFLEMEPLESIFEDIDREFIGINKACDETFVYKASDVLVQSIWELPIVIQCPDSTVNFRFSCTPSDISFGVKFVAAPEEDQNHDEIEVETIGEMGLVEEPARGSFLVPCEGMVFFVFNNDHDWTTVKMVSYSIEVIQPSFTYSDNVRSKTSQYLLHDVADELGEAYSRVSDAQITIKQTAARVLFLEEQIQSMQLELDAKKRIQEVVSAKMVESQAIITKGRITATGLAIRTLNQHLLSDVLSYLHPDGGSNLVCRYWADLAQSNKKGTLAGATPRSVAKAKKISKKDVHAALAEIRVHSPRNSQRPPTVIETRSAEAAVEGSEGTGTGESHILAHNAENGREHDNESLGEAQILLNKPDTIGRSHSEKATLITHNNETAFGFV